MGVERCAVQAQALCFHASLVSLTHPPPHRICSYVPHLNYPPTHPLTVSTSYISPISSPNTQPPHRIYSSLLIHFIHPPTAHRICSL